MSMSAAGAQTPAPVPVAQASYSGYTTGTAVHVGAVQFGTTQLANVEQAFAGAAVNSKGLSGTINNELGQVVQPTLPNTSLDTHLVGNKSFARGSGLEVGLATTTPVTSNTIPLNRAEVSAPPSSTETKQIGPINVNGVASASLLKGQAAANWNPDNTCVLGAPISRGLGEAAGAKVLNTAPIGGGGTAVVATDATGNNVSQTISQTELAPQTNSSGASVGPNVGLISESTQNLAPVTLFKGTPAQFTIKVGGSFTLRAVAGGVPGSAYISYTPGQTQPTPTTPVLSILNSVGTILNTITTQQLLGSTGLNVPVSLGTLGTVANISVGQAPRAIGGAVGSSPQIAADGTSASAAVDVASVHLLDIPSLNLHGANVTIGHLEAKAVVPSGGIACQPIPVSKTANPITVHPGQQFTYTIGVTNPCLSPLTGVRVVDTISAPSGVHFTITSTSPTASTISPDNSTITYNDIGPIPASSTKDLTITVQVASNSAGGVLTDHAAVAGSCGTGSASGTQTISVPLSGSVTVMVPTVTLVASPAPKAVTPTGPLPFTGEAPWIPVTGAGLGVMAIAGLVLRRRLSH